MPDQSASPADEPLTEPWMWERASAMSSGRRPPFVTSPEQEEFIRRWFTPPLPPKWTVDDQGVVLSSEETLRARDQALYCATMLRARDQALYCATMMFDTSPFPEDAERVIEIAKRFESYIRTGE